MQFSKIAIFERVCTKAVCYAVVEHQELNYFVESWAISKGFMAINFKSCL